jgi:hypothetical protein
LLKDVLDPEGVSNKNDKALEREFCYTGLANAFARAEMNIHNQSYSMTRFGLVVLEAIQKYLDKQVPLEVTR